MTDGQQHRRSIKKEKSLRKTLIATVVVAIAFPAFAQQQPGRQPANPDANTPAVNSPNSPPNPGAPVAGANSFTEGQAKSRIEAKGFTRTVAQEVGPTLRSHSNVPSLTPMAPSRSYAVEVLKCHPVVTSIVVGLAASAILNRVLAKKAERRNPPTGRFITIDGVRLHYVERGTGRPLVLLHGNGSMIQDFESSGLVDLAAKTYRVIAFDRPGFGHSDRPRSTVWTPEAQADLLNAALVKMGVSQPLVLGHSWGTLVAVALALNYPRNVRALILASGYYYPTVRADVLVLSPPAMPLVGDVLSHTISPILGRLLWPLFLRKIFGPNPVPKKFAGFPEEMAMRPSQIRAAAAETALMIPSAYQLPKGLRTSQNASGHRCRHGRSSE